MSSPSGSGHMLPSTHEISGWQFLGVTTPTTLEAVTATSESIVLAFATVIKQHRGNIVRAVADLHDRRRDATNSLCVYMGNGRTPEGEAKILALKDHLPTAFEQFEDPGGIVAEARSRYPVEWAALRHGCHTMVEQIVAYRNRRDDMASTAAAIAPTRR